MGTRSRVGVMHGDKCKSIYVHWDGYLSGVGKTLLEHYDSARANHLVALGDVSSLGTEIGEQHNGEDITHGTWTTFYGRDHGRASVEFIVSNTFEEFMERVNQCHAEYYYIMQDGVWYCGDNYGSGDMSGRLVELSKALAWEALQA